MNITAYWGESACDVESSTADVDLTDDGADEAMRARDEFDFSVGIRFGEVPLPKLRATLTREQHDRTRRPGVAA